MGLTILFRENHSWPTCSNNRAIYRLIVVTFILKYPTCAPFLKHVNSHPLNSRTLKVGCLDNILAELNRRMDHTLLTQGATSTDILRLCEETVRYRLFSAVVNPLWVSLAADRLKETDSTIVAAVSFPLGATLTDFKVTEAVKAVEDGAHEIDMVASIGGLLDNKVDLVRREIEAVRKKLPDSVVLKVIIEATILSRQQQTDATRAVVDGGAQFVKTSTGFYGGASVEQIKRLKIAAAGHIGIKASGGIKTVDQCRQLLAAGATRLGSSRSVHIMQEYQKTGF